jgi:hypothetical protein
MYKTMPQRVIGAAAFAILATSLLLEPLGSALVIDSVAKPVYDFFIHYRVVIVTVCLVLAILDLLITKSSKPRKEH